MLKSNKKLGEILTEKGLVTPESLKEALADQAHTGEYLGDILVKKGMIAEKDLLFAVSEQFGIPFVELRNQYIDWQAAKSFSASLVLEYKYLPFKRDNLKVTIAITDPFNVWALKKAEEEARGLQLELVLVSSSDMDEATQRYKKYMGTNTLKQI
ncbi:MAG: hypothetical protein WC301_05000 [Candidatus Omnitrophota bacterium]|jgi:type IV pilus assembly protein PilB